jgi:hypothetical protein
MPSTCTTRAHEIERNEITKFFTEGKTNADEIMIDALLFYDTICNYREKNKVIHRGVTISILSVCIYKAHELHNKCENGTLDEILHSLGLKRGNYLRVKKIVDNIVDEMVPQIKLANKN